MPVSATGDLPRLGQLGQPEAPMKTAVAWRAAMASDTGSQRTNNEDRVYIDEAQGLFLVIDGVGGHAGGERAAEMAADIIPRQLEMLAGPVEDRVRTAITLAN